MSRAAEAPKPDVLMYEHLFEGQNPSEILRDLCEGVLACTQNAARLLDDAGLLVQSSVYASATFLTSMAREEIAKAYILLDACRLDQRQCHSSAD